MAGHSTYVNKGYDYTDVPAHGGGYVYEPEHGNSYVVETTTVERFRVPVPVVGYTTQFGGVPRDHLEGYERTYGSEYDNSSPDKYRSTSPKNYHTTSPNKYRSRSPDKYRPTSPDKYRTTSPNKYRTTSLNKYPSTSLTHNYPSNEAHLSNGQTLPVPNNYRPTSPTKYRPTSPTSNYSLKEDGLIKAQNLPSPNKYQPTSQCISLFQIPRQYVTLFRTPPNNHWQNEAPRATHHPLSNPTNDIDEAVSLLAVSANHSLRADPNKYQPTSQCISLFQIPRQGVTLFRTPPNNHWQNEAPHATHHPLSNPTNDIDEAVSLLAVSANHSLRADPKRGAFDNMSTHARPIEHKRRYARPTFRGGSGSTRYTGSNAIDSHEAKKRYNGAYVP